MKLWGRMGATAFSLALWPMASLSAQEERGIDRPIELRALFPNYTTVRYVPLNDVARALGSRVQFDEARQHYSVHPGEGGILRISPRRAGIRVLDRKLRYEETNQRNSDGRTLTFGIGEQLVSAGIIIIEGRPHIPLDDLAAAMGIIVEDRPSPGGDGTVPTLIPKPGSSPLLRLSRRGIIIIEGKEP